MGRTRHPNSKARQKNQPLAKKDKAWSDQDYVETMALYNLYHNYSEVSRQTGVPASTIQNWVRDQGQRKTKIFRYDQRLKETQDRLMESMGYVAEKALQQTYEKLPDASAAQAATIYGILFDKQQMIVGSAGSSNFNFNLDLSGMDPDQAVSLMQRVIDRKQEKPVIEADAEVIGD